MGSIGRISGRALVLVGLVSALIIWWWWPGLSGSGSKLDVLIVSAQDSEDDVDVLSRRLREEGFRTEWNAAADDECSLELRGESPKMVVLLLSLLEGCPSAAAEASIEKLVDTVGGHRVFAVASWEEGSDTDLFSKLDLLGAVGLDPTRLIGNPNQAQPCLWWDDCPASGSIETVRNGVLTEAGRERMARFVVSGVL